MFGRPVLRITTVPNILTLTVADWWIGGKEYREQAIYITQRLGIGLGLTWMNSLPASEKQSLTRELRPKVITGEYMILSKDIAEEEVVNILKKHGFVKSRDMVEVGAEDKMVTKMIKL